MATDKKALNAMTRARTCLVVSQPFFGCLALQLQLVEVLDPNVVNTMAVDGKNLFYHPPFVLKLKEPEVIGVVAHETMHCAYKHMLRRGHRDHMFYNIAGDFIINSDLKKAGFQLPGQPITLASKPGTSGYLYDPQYDGMSTEEVYERLIQQAKKVTIMIGDGNKKDFGGCGAVLDASSGGGKDGKESQSGADVATLEAEWDANVRMAVAVAKGSNAGKIPGHLECLVNAMNKPIINWKEQMRDFVSNSCSKDYSWSRPNRRSVACGVILPGFISDGMHQLVMVMDVSGSIDDSMRQTYASEGQGMLDDGVCDVMTLVYTDTEVKKVDEFLRGDIIKVKTPCGGGTDFKAVMDWIPENCPDAAAIVFLTDMETCSFGADPGIPVLWGATMHHSRLQTLNVPFGRVIEVREG